MYYSMKQARIGALLSQKDAAEKLGIHINTYRRYEEHPMKIPMDLAFKFCEIVNLKIDDIWFAD